MAPVPPLDSTVAAWRAQEAVEETVSGPEPGLPLAEASRRLRGRPGRPRNLGHDAGITPSQVGAKSVSPDRPSVRGAAGPRLLDVRAAAAYLGVSSWTVRDLEAAGALRRVRLPLPSGREVRRVLYDRLDLDRLVEGLKEPAA